MSDITQELQVGGTVDPKRYLYIERPEDDQVLNLLLKREFVNILTSRQMGKSSLMVRTARALHENGVAFATIDLAGELGSQNEPDTYFLGLLNKICRDLRLSFDLKTWWRQQEAQTVNQRLLAFFRNILPEHLDSSFVIFLDEIDSTLKLPFTDDLFTVLRTIYNERPLVAEYQRVSFCLLGVATPDELVKDRRTTPYNVGKTIELRDFDTKIDDLSPLINMFSAELVSEEHARILVERVLYWTGGQPYLTMKLCADLKANQYATVEQIDHLVKQKFADLDQVKADSHFQQVLRFVDHRFSDGLYSLDLYEKVLNGEQIEDQAALPFFELRLSGLLKRAPDGKLKIRNQIYQQLFDQDWINSTLPRQELKKTNAALALSRKRASRANKTAGLSLVGLVTVLIAYGVWYAPKQRTLEDTNVGQQRETEQLQAQIAVREQLAQLNVAVVADNDLGFEVLELPRGLTQAEFEKSVQLGRGIEQVAGVRFSENADCEPETSGITSIEFMREHKAWKVLEIPCIRVSDLSPLSNLTALWALDLSGSQVSDLSNLSNLSALRTLILANTQVGDISSISNLNALQRLDLNGTLISDVSSLSGLASLETLDLANTQVSDVSSISNLNALQWLDLNGTLISDVSSLSNLTSLQTLRFSGTQVRNISSLASLVALRELDSSDTQVSDVSSLTNLTSVQWFDLTGTLVSDVESLANFTGLQTLSLANTSVSDVSSLSNITSLKWLGLASSQVRDISSFSKLTLLQTLDLSSTQVSDLLALIDIPSLKELNIEGTNVTREHLNTFLEKRTKIRANLEVISGFDKYQGSKGGSGYTPNF